MGGLSAEELCNQGAQRSGDDAHLICELQDDFIAAGWKQSNKYAHAQPLCRARGVIDGEVEAFIRAATAPWQVHLPSCRNEKLGKAGATGAGIRSLVGQSLDDSSVITSHGLLNMVGRIAGRRSANQCEQHASGAFRRRSCYEFGLSLEAKSTLRVVISCFWQVPKAGVS